MSIDMRKTNRGSDILFKEKEEQHYFLFQSVAEVAIAAFYLYRIKKKIQNNETHCFHANENQT